MKEIKPIAFFRSPLTSKFGIPRQSGLAGSLVGRIVFEPPYRREEALRGLEDFDYLWLVWGFSANRPSDGVQLTVRPPRLGGLPHGRLSARTGSACRLSASGGSLTER